MANLMKRDMDILKILSLGVATSPMIRSLLAAYGYTFSLQVLFRRLSIDRRAGFIITRRISFSGRRGNYTAYAITKIAIEILTEFGHSCDEMRIGLPKTMFVNHEINVTKVLHIVHTESLEGFYKYNFVDSYLLKMERLKGSKKAIPDLKLIIRLKVRTVELNIEVDLGTVLTRKMIHRIVDQANDGNIVLIMCTSRKRLENLHQACSGANLYNRKNVLFVMAEDFYAGGLMNTDLLTMDDKLVRVNLEDE
jgi:hypothetical protein